MAANSFDRSAPRKAPDPIYLVPTAAAAASATSLLHTTPAVPFFLSLFSFRDSLHSFCISSAAGNSILSAFRHRLSVNTQHSSSPRQPSPGHSTSRVILPLLHYLTYLVNLNNSQSSTSAIFSLLKMRQNSRRTQHASARHTFPRPDYPVVSTDLPVRITYFVMVSFLDGSHLCSLPSICSSKVANASHLCNQAQ